MSKGLKKLELGALSFVANGKKYFIESGLSINRYVEYQQIELSAGMGMNYNEMVKGLNEVRDKMNTANFVDASVKLHNIMIGAYNIQKKEPALLKLCALFINEENEDRSVITPEMITQKISDWGEYEVEGFFALALTSIGGFIENYKKMHQAFIE